MSMPLRRSLALIAVMFCLAGFGLGSAADKGHHGAKGGEKDGNFVSRLLGSKDADAAPARGGKAHRGMKNDDMMPMMEGRMCGDLPMNGPTGGKTYRMMPMERTAGSIAVYGRPLKSQMKPCEPMKMRPDCTPKHHPMHDMGGMAGMDRPMPRHHMDMGRPHHPRGDMAAMDAGRPAGGSDLDRAVVKMNHAMMMPSTGNPDADFMRGMIAHHQGAIDMAKAVLKDGKDPEVRALARSIIAAQTGEIKDMRHWLKVRHMTSGHSGGYRFNP